MKYISKLHIITNHISEENSHLHQIEKLKNSSADWIQLRVKDADQAEWFEIGRQAKEILRHTDIKLIVNDNIYLAKEIDADGVHVGKHDMDPLEAREILGPDKIIGGTANDYEDIQRLYDMGVDYIGLGPFAETKTKENLSPVLGFVGYSALLRYCRDANIDIPIIAIGGIGEIDAEELIGLGVYGIAASSKIVSSDDIAFTVDEFQNAIIRAEPGTSTKALII